MPGSRSGATGATLIGRARELRALEQMLDATRHGSPGVAAVLGEPGIGKTRVLEELCVRAAAAGWTIVSGRGSEFERDIPYGLVVDALDDPLGALGPRAVAGLAGHVVAELGAILPSLADHTAGRPGGLDVERFKFHHAVRTAFAWLARDRPMLVVFDDVHWADPATVELLGYLLRRPVPRVMPVLAYRPRQASHGLSGAVELAIRDRGLRAFELEPFSVDESADLLGMAAESASLRRLHTEGAGNPFYIEQLARIAESPRGANHVDPDATSHMKVSISGALARELSAVPAEALEILRAAAVAGDPFEVDLVGDITAMDTADVTERLDVLVVADLIRASGIPGQFRFRHPIVRRFVYDDMLPGRRVDAHKRAAYALAGRGAPTSSRAHHIERSAGVGDNEAIASLVEAGTACAARAPAAAAEWFATSLRLLSDNSGIEQRLPIVMLLASSLAASGKLGECRRALERALELLSDRSLSERVPIIGMIARADLGLGRAEQAYQLITSALEQADPDGADAVMLRMDLAENHLMMGRWQQAVDTAAQAHVQARVLGDPAAIVAATSKLGWFTSYRGDIAAAQELVELAGMEMDSRLGGAEAGLLDALADLMYAETAVDRFRAAARHAERGLRVSRSTGHSYAYCRFTFGEITNNLMVGRLEEARTAADNSVEAAMLLDNDQLLATAQGLRCWVETERGDTAAALAAGRSAADVAHRSPDALFAWLAHACYGEALIEAGEAERGRDEFASLGSELDGIPPSTRPFWQQALITAELGAGRIAAAEAIAAQMATAGTDLQSRQGHAHLARSRVLLARDEYDLAVQSAQQAGQCFGAIEMRIWVARARLVAGRALARAGADADAVRELDIAHSVFANTGARRLRDETAKELRVLGQRVRPARSLAAWVEPTNLTGRERAIADGVIEGHTNREIATQLFISPKTVEKHLAKIFTKLGVSSRAGLVAALSTRRMPRE